MLATAHAQAMLGLDGVPVEVEAHVARGVPSFQIVGLPDRAVMEARERVRSKLMASVGAQWRWCVVRRRAW